MSYACRLASPLGMLTLLQEGNALSALYFPGSGIPNGAEYASTALLCAAGRQLDEYFTGRRTIFDLPLQPAGTPFQQAVWQSLRAIPYGETRTYGQIAAEVGKPNAARAVGQANHNNPLPILIPCHRVVGSGGALTGYAGGLSIKKFLLDLEQQ